MDTIVGTGALKNQLAVVVAPVGFSVVTSKSQLSEILDMHFSFVQKGVAVLCSFIIVARFRSITGE